MHSEKDTASRRGSRGRVLWVAAEISPHASAGGLGEVVRTLPAALLEAGWDVSVLVPFYRPLAEAVGARASEVFWRDDIEIGSQSFAVGVRRLKEAGAPELLLLDCPPLYGRDGLYGDAKGSYPDNDVRFGLLSHAAVRFVHDADPAFDLVHVHDWHTALVPGLMGTAHGETAGPATLLTIHNLAYQGVFDQEARNRLRLPEAAFASRTADPSGVNFLEAGIRWADALTTVSPNYALEVRGEGRGEGLETVLRERGHDLVGILNGLDDEDWNPAATSRLAASYDMTTPARKVANKIALQEELGLVVDGEKPLLGYFGRFAPQKGLDIFLDAIPRLLNKGVQAAIAGSGDPTLERRAVELEAAFPQRVATNIGYDVDFTHRFLAGLDILVMPSRFEPCGLTQLQALRYGTIPVAHAVGGLVDTVHPIGTRGGSRGPSNGFLFHTLGTRGLSLAVGKALRYYAQPELWRNLQRNAMGADLSWRPAVEAYGALYEDLLTANRPRRAASLAASSPSVSAAPSTSTAPSASAAPSSAPAPMAPVAPPVTSAAPVPPAPIAPPATSAAPVPPAPIAPLATSAAPAPPEPQPGFVDFGPSLPETYGEPALHLLVQSPRLLYAYWELPRSAEAEGVVHLELEDDAEGRILDPCVSPVGEFWVSVQPEQTYRVRLQGESTGTLLESNRATTPPDAARLGGELRWRRFDLAALRGGAATPPHPEVPAPSLAKATALDVQDSRSSPLGRSFRPLGHPSGAGRP